MNKVLFIIIAIFISPVAVALVEGFNMHFWINLVLYIFSCGLLGLVHAIYLILTRDYEIMRK